MSQPGERVIEIIGDLKYELDNYCAAIVADWEQRNPHPATGYASSPENLTGAARAMNAKYGPGTVTWP
jgi:hypothetical protein